ncbi:16S rRNA (guanine(966)-N(2))-methyltransferase RsmD [Candidatus Omnitrophota bacterium]
MRIISGQLKGRKIELPAGIRPTQDKVRKALFDILGDISGLSLLELYAGSGAVGLEALSQGAGRVVFVDKDRECIKVIRENIAKMGISAESETSHCRVIAMDIEEAIKRLDKRGEQFEVVFLDPPYYQELVKKTLKMLNRCDILSPCGFVVCQHFKKDSLPAETEGLILVKQAEYGDTVLSFYKKRQ